MQMDKDQEVKQKIKEIYDRFLKEVDILRKEHGQKINAILKEIDAEQLQRVRENLRNM